MAAPVGTIRAEMSAGYAQFGKDLGKAKGLVKKNAKGMSKAMYGAKKSFDNALGSIKAVGLAVGAGFSTVALVRSVRASVEAFQKLETATVDMAKVTDRNLSGLVKDVRTLDSRLGNSTELMQGYYQVISAGVKGAEKQMQTLVTASKLAKAAHINQAEAIKGLTKLMAGFEGQIESTAEAADLLFTIEKEGQTSVLELIPVIGGLAKVSSDLSVSTDELGAAMATLSKTAGSTAEAATQYRAILFGLFKPQENMLRVFKDLNVASGEQLVRMFGLEGAIKRVQKSAEKLGFGLGKVFKSMEALTGISALTANDFSAYESSLDAMTEKAGSAETAWKNWRETLEGELTGLSTEFDNLKIAIGEAFSDEIRGLIDGVAKSLKKVKDSLPKKGDITGPQVDKKTKTLAEETVGFLGFYIKDFEKGQARFLNELLTFSQLMRRDLDKSTDQFNTGKTTKQTGFADPFATPSVFLPAKEETRSLKDFLTAAVPEYKKLLDHAKDLSRELTIQNDKEKERLALYRKSEAAVGKILDKLRKQESEVGLDDREKIIKKITSQSAGSKENVKEANALLDSIAIKKEQIRLDEKGKELVLNARDNLAVYNDTLREYNELLLAGSITQEQFNGLMEGLKEGLIGSEEGLKIYNAEMAKLNQSLADGKIEFEEYDKAAEKALENLGSSTEGANDQFEDLKNTINGWAADSADAILEFTKGGEDAFKNMVDSFIDDLLRMAITKKITEPIFAGFSSFLGGGGIASLFGKASGGSVSSGGLYEVNERRPEIFNLGGRQFMSTASANGRVIPDASGSGEGLTISVPMTIVGRNPAMQAELRREMELTAENVIRRHS